MGCFQVSVFDSKCPQKSGLLELGKGGIISIIFNLSLVPMFFYLSVQII